MLTKKLQAHKTKAQPNKKIPQNNTISVDLHIIYKASWI